MAYTPTNWTNFPSTATPVNASNLNKIETELVALDTEKADESAVTTALAEKVDKVAGKGLSTEDFTTEEKTKLAGISSQANKVEITPVVTEGTTLATISIDGVDTDIKGSDIDVDNQLKPDSTNPVQNKVIYEALNNILPEETAEGNPISITDASGLNAKSCEVSFSPIQSGSGDPSPTNIRPISGWDSLHLYQDTEQTETPETTHTATFPETIYGGNYDFVSGICTDTYTNTLTLSSSMSWGTSGQTAYIEITDAEIVDSYGEGICEIFKQVKDFTKLGNGTEIGFCIYKYSSWNKARLVFSLNGLTLTEFKALIDGYKVAYVKATPQEITLTPETIALLKGNNTLWTDGDNITLKYSADIKQWVLSQLQS